MASWKKVLVESANISVGTITATLGDNTTDLSASNHASIELVVSESNVLKTRTADFGTAAFSDATDFATAAQGSTADSALQSSDFAAELVTGTAAGKGGIAVTGGTNAIKGGDGDDIQLDLDINSIVTTITSVASSDLIPLEDATDNVTKKATVANILSAAGVTQFNAGRNLTEADGDTTGTIDLDLDVNLVQVNSIKATEGSGSNATGSSLQLHGGAGTGSGAGGGIRLKVADGGSSGSTLNSYATAVQVNDDKTTDFNEKISITAAAGGTAINAGDFDIVNVNDLKGCWLTTTQTWRSLSQLLQEVALLVLLTTWLLLLFLSKAAMSICSSRLRTVQRKLKLVTAFRVLQSLLVIPLLKPLLATTLLLLVT